MLYLYLISCIVSLAISTAYAMIWRRRFNICFTIVEFIAPAICVANLMRCASTTLDSAIAANNIIYLAGCFFVPLLFFGITSVCNIKIKRIWVILAFAVQFVVYAGLLTNNYHHLFYTKLAAGEANECFVLVKEYGPLHTVAYALMAIYLIVSFIVILYSYRKKRKAAHKHLILCGILLPVSCLLYFGGRLILGPGQEEVITYLLCQLVVLYLSRDSSFNYVDYYMVDSLSEGHGLGCIAFDENRRLLVCNEQAEEWFPELTELHVGKRVISAGGINPRFSEWFDRFKFSNKPFSEIVKSRDFSIRFDVSLKEIAGRKCFCFILTDDTAQQELLKVLNNDIERVTGAVKKYMDPHTFVSMMDDSSVSTNGQEFTIAIMFADLRGFTSLTENIETHRTVEILNKYLTLAESAIHKHGGILDKYIGDAVMAYWIDIKGDGSAALQAAKAALEIKNSMISIEDNIYKDLSTELFYGIGLNYGKAILGSVGSENLKSYTAIGDTVNVAARLESIAPKNTIFITQNFRDVLGDSISIGSVEKELRVKGKAAPLKVYELAAVGKESVSLRKKAAVPEIASVVIPSVVTPPAGKAMLYICGCRGSYPVSGVRFAKFGGETTCYVLKINKYAVVIDCGTGFLNAGPLLADCTKIDVLLTHMHYDHCIGLLNWSVFPQGVTPTFYGNFDKWYGEKTISELFRPPFWPVDLSKGELVSVPDRDEMIMLSMQERVGVRFFDSMHPNNTKLLLIEVAGKRVCVMCDCEHAEAIPLKYLKGVDYLIYDGMYDDSEYEKHIGWGHSTWQEGVRLAQKAGVDQLIISHHDAKSSDVVLLEREEKARLMRRAVAFAKVGDQYAL